MISSTERYPKILAEDAKQRFSRFLAGETQVVGGLSYRLDANGDVLIVDAQGERPAKLTVDAFIRYRGNTAAERGATATDKKEVDAACRAACKLCRIRVSLQE